MVFPQPGNLHNMTRVFSKLRVGEFSRAAGGTPMPACIGFNHQKVLLQLRQDSSEILC